MVFFLPACALKVPCRQTGLDLDHGLDFPWVHDVANPRQSGVHQRIKHTNCLIASVAQKRGSFINKSKFGRPCWESNVRFVFFSCPPPASFICVFFAFPPFAQKVFQLTPVRLEQYFFLRCVLAFEAPIRYPIFFWQTAVQSPHDEFSCVGCGAWLVEGVRPSEFDFFLANSEGAGHFGTFAVVTAICILQAKPASSSNR